MAKIIFDENRCIGCGYCFSIATSNFECNDEGRASLINDTVTPEAIEASEGCPVSAILIEETDNNNTVTPANETNIKQTHECNGDCENCNKHNE